MNPFRKRSKTIYGSNGNKLRRRDDLGGLSGAPHIIATADLAFSLPSENAFRTSLLMPKMADRFSILRLDDPNEKTKGIIELKTDQQMLAMHSRDLSILEERDEEDEDLPVRPWERRQDATSGDRFDHNGISKDEFIRVRAQEGNSTLFSSKQRTFKFRSEDGNGNPFLSFSNSNPFRYEPSILQQLHLFQVPSQSSLRVQTAIFPYVNDVVDPFYHSQTTFSQSETLQEQAGLRFWPA